MVSAESMQVSTLASPIKCLVGMIVLLLYWPSLSQHVSGDFARQLDLVSSLYGARR